MKDEEIIWQNMVTRRNMVLCSTGNVIRNVQLTFRMYEVTDRSCPADVGVWLGVPGIG